MRANQYAFDAKYADELRLMESFRQESVSGFVTRLPDPDDARAEWALAPHPKRSIRMAAVRSLTATAWHTFTGTPVVQFKQKPHELLGPTKYPRGLGDLSVIGAAKLGYYMDAVKEGFRKPYVVDDVSSRFIKCATYDETLVAFEEIINGTEMVNIVYHSDDACLGADCVEGRVYWNIDISQCDGSHHDPTFNSLRRIMQCEPRFDMDINGCFAQCRLPLRVRSEDGRESVTLKPKFYTLYSGSVLTTALNNTSVERATVALRVLLRRHGCRPTAQELQAFVVTAFAEAGYRVKIDVCTYIEDLQFLKRSPCYGTDGRLTHFLNLGVWLRGFGQCYGDLPGRSSDSLHDRAERYMSGVVASHVHDGDHVISSAFRARFPHTTLSFNVGTRYYSLETHRGFIPTEALCSRYRASTAEFIELADHILGLTPGIVSRSPLIDAIFRKDYGF
jgi:hypothetical protein